MTRYIHVAHRLTGWNAVKNRAEQLGLELDDEQLKYLTSEIKAAADHRGLTLDDVDFCYMKPPSAMMWGNRQGN